MAKESIYQADALETIDAVLRNAQTGQVCVVSTGSFEVWGTSGHTRTNYAIAHTSDGGLLYTADMPDNVPVGDYFFVYTARQGDLPADDDPYRGQSQAKHWNGSALVDIPEESGRHLCLLADVKTRLGVSNTDNDLIIESIIAGIDGAFDNYVNRTLLMTDADVTEYFGADPGWQRLLLKRYPIISITSIKEAANYDFDSAEALVVNEDYRIVNSGLNGIIYRIDGRWLAGEDVIQVISRGGYCGAGETPSTGEHAIPNELREAAILQATFMFKRKDDIGLNSVSTMGGSISKFADVELLPLVKQVLDKYKRPSL
ncbi:MAG: hypothetical protein ABSB91_00260 [Sedimentisphaerales bacterium]